MDLEMDPPFDYVTAHWRRMDVEILRMRNDFRDHEQAYKAYMAAQNQRQSMQTHLDKITALIDPGGGGGGVHLQTHLTALQEALTSQGSALEKMVKSIPPMARRPLGADELADKVFSIPELLERILLYLSTSDLLRVQRVDRQFSAAVQASPRIQMKMGLRQQEKCHIRFPIGPGDVYAFCFSSETYYCFTQQGRQRVGGNEVTVRVEVYTSEKTPLPKPGRRCRDVLICQPPIRALNVYTRCCAPQWPYRTSNGPSETIERENGVRFGDLLDAYLRIAEAHRLCPDADPELHDENGFVKPRISFEANVVALDDDPKLLDRQRYEKKRKTEEERWRASEVRMGPYIAAKRLARDNGQPIPTLAEFEKARDEVENETAPANLP